MQRPSQPRSQYFGAQSLKKWVQRPESERGAGFLRQPPVRYSLQRYTLTVTFANIIHRPQSDNAFKESQKFGVILAIGFKKYPK